MQVNTRDIVRRMLLESPNIDVETQGLNSRSFQTWFAGSKIVDKAGNPMPVYHGTMEQEYNDNWKVALKQATRMAYDHMGLPYPGDDTIDASLDKSLHVIRRFTQENPGVIPDDVRKEYNSTFKPRSVFDLAKLGSNAGTPDTKLGFFFTPDIEFARRFTYQVNMDPFTRKKTYINGRHPYVYAVYLKIRKPLDLSKATIRNAKDIDRSEIFPMEWGGYEELLSLIRNAEGSKNLQKWLSRDKLEAAGYNGVINKVLKEDGKVGIEIIAMYPWQIKAVTSTGFNIEDPNIFA